MINEFVSTHIFCILYVVLPNYMYFQHKDGNLKTHREKIQSTNQSFNHDIIFTNPKTFGSQKSLKV